jgi:NADH:ubiquinone oxidoreductase subunit F (NADH-binding)
VIHSITIYSGRGRWINFTKHDPMKHQRRYRDTHGGDEPVLIRIKDSINSGPELKIPDIKKLSQEVCLPEPTVRGLVSFYTDLHSSPQAVRICQGTSCKLAGADKLKSQLETRFECRDVFCLGFCDRSPVILDSKNRLFSGSAAWRVSEGAETAPDHSFTPSARCLAREPITLTRVLRGDCSGLKAARSAGAYRALPVALVEGPAEVLRKVEESGQRGRGGAGFPTGTKWRSCAEAPGSPRFVVVNGDEGDPGSFIDRVLMEDDPHAVLEGTILCGFAVGASQGIIFIRSEYPRAIAHMEQAIGEARRAGILGASVMGSRFAFDVSVFTGFGSYVCGEETALLNAIEGQRGEVRIRPPYPTVEGLYGKPTVINNVETLVNIPPIVERGPRAYSALGTEKSKGTKVMCMNQGFAKPGLLEVEFGMTLREVIGEAGGGAGGKRLEAVVLGGPMGSVLFPDEWDVPVCYGAMAQRDIRLGHGGLVAIPEGTDFRVLLKHWLEFMKEESCGKCVPCRLGSERAWNLVHNGGRPESRAELEHLLEVIEEASLCAFGQSMPGPMRTLLRHFAGQILRDGGQA